MTAVPVLDAQPVGEVGEDLARRDLHADPRFVQTRYQLCNMLKVTHYTLTSQAVRAAARMDEEISQRFPGRQVAILIDGPVAYGLARMYQLHAPRSQWDTQIFRNESEARGWLMRLRRTVPA